MSSIHSLSQHEPHNEKSTLQSPEGQPLQTTEESSTVPAFSFTWNSSHTVMTALSLLIVGFFGLQFLTLSTWSANIFLTAAPSVWIAQTCDLGIAMAIFSLICGAIPTLSLSGIIASAAVNIIAFISISTINMVYFAWRSHGVAYNILSSLALAAGIAVVFLGFYSLSAVTLRPLLLRWLSRNPRRDGKARNYVVPLLVTLIILLTLGMVYALVTDVFFPGSVPATSLFLAICMPFPAFLFTWLAVYPYSQLRWFILGNAVVNIVIEAGVFLAYQHPMRVEDYAAVFAILIPYVLGAIAGTITKGVIMRRRARMEKKA